jgi:hypothetical protein
MTRCTSLGPSFSSPCGGADHVDIGGDDLAGGRPGQQSQQGRHIGKLFENLLQTHHGHMHVGCGGAHAAVALVLHQQQGAGFGNGKIHTAQSHLGFGEALAQHAAGNVRQFFHIFGIRRLRNFFVKNGGHLVFVFVNGRHDNVRWRFVVELNDEFTQIGLHGLEAMGFEETVQVHLLGNHGFAFDDFLCVVTLHDVQHDVVGRVRSLRPSAPGYRCAYSWLRAVPAGGAIFSAHGV